MRITAHQRAILVYIARGYATKEIAAALGRSVCNINAAKRRIFRRNGIRNDMQLGMAIERCNVLSLEERQRIEDRRQVVLKARELQ
jgi:DNA-binding NarL/FixJ family response regulator